MAEIAQTDTLCGTEEGTLRTPKSKRQNIILIGMPAVGKTTIAKRVAKAASMTFLDTDRIIESEEGKTIPQLLELHGTDGFVSIENRICATLRCKGCIVATGGSVVYGEDAMRHLCEIGTVVYLKLSFPLLQKRLHTPGKRGVVLRPGQTLYELYLERVPLYEKYADIVIDERTCYPSQTAQRVYRALCRYGFFRGKPHPVPPDYISLSKKKEAERSQHKQAKP